MVRWCWVNLQCRGVLLIRIRVGQGPIALAVGAGGGCLDIFSLLYPFSPLSPSLWETARYRLKYCLKGPLNPQQPTNQPLEKNLCSAELSMKNILLLRGQISPVCLIQNRKGKLLTSNPAFLGSGKARISLECYFIRS